MRKSCRSKWETEDCAGAAPQRHGGCNAAARGRARQHRADDSAAGDARSGSCRTQHHLAVVPATHTQNTSARTDTHCPATGLKRNGSRAPARSTHAPARPTRLEPSNRADRSDRNQKTRSRHSACTARRRHEQEIEFLTCCALELVRRCAGENLAIKRGAQSNHPQATGKGVTVTCHDIANLSFQQTARHRALGVSFGHHGPEPNRGGDLQYLARCIRQRHDCGHRPGNRHHGNRFQTTCGQVHGSAGSFSFGRRRARHAGACRKVVHREVHAACLSAHPQHADEVGRAQKRVDHALIHACSQMRAQARIRLRGFRQPGACGPWRAGR